MRVAIKLMGVILAGIGVWGFSGRQTPHSFKFPYEQAGLTERQAAAHLLSRFTYGSRPGEVDAVVQMGLENWFSRQLEAQLPDDSLVQVLSRYDALELSNQQVAETYPRNGQVVRMAVRDGIINKDSVKTDRKEYRQALQAYMQEKGIKREQELFRQFFCQKIMRAAYSQNQLQEVMTDFWFNHFNVSITKNDCAEFIPAYERDIIRPNALGRFTELLLKTAKSPAMLYYLDNFSSSAPLAAAEVGPAEVGPASKAEGRRRSTVGLAPKAEGGRRSDGKGNFEEGSLASGGEVMADSMGQQTNLMSRLQQARKNRGINENYAREVMELHTLGVDGGYSQQDVTQAARVLTGWGVYPMGEYAKAGGAAVLKRYSDDQIARRGFVHEGDFFFNANRHDKGEKTVLGHIFPAGGGYEEGVQLLEMLAHQPATARFISRKLAVRFVSDDPPALLIDKMAKTFLEKNGDIRQVLITMVTAPEFWSKEALREKTKSPFELAIGSVRSLHATIDQPMQLYNWVTRMGEKKYYYQAPTGYPDKGNYWINTGSLLNRMNFGLALASGRVPGVHVDLLALNNGHEPESAQAALLIYGHIILPERDLAPTVKRLTPMLNDPTFTRKVEDASNNGEVAVVGGAGNGMEASRNGWDGSRSGADTSMKRSDAEGPAIAMNVEVKDPMLAQVVGIIIGSPEYQRR